MTTVVNISSVRHLSPFRYPGGKTWLVPRVLEELQKLPRRPTVFVDPFTGGGSVPLAALVEDLVDRLVLCEIDPDVAAVWKTIFSSSSDSLCDRIANFDMCRPNVLEIITAEPLSHLDRAFQTIVRNRTFRGGILARGASLVKNGENGRGLASRWYPETLIKRIQFLSRYTSRVDFRFGDGIPTLREFAQRDDAFVFVDPPYTAGTGKRAGSRLYSHNLVDHEDIFSVVERGRAKFLMTYDDDLDVLRLCLRSGFVLEHLRMKNTHHRELSEILIKKN